eukprot:gb/GECH01000307.1/.p1 GENE.gb/GECH01000307.1/~~gb/GECH01000307.1/.p1  ORF type:complete len:596 (+),score=145.02 gb/GECH01000307.1/:1-1788(+)
MSPTTEKRIGRKYIDLIIQGKNEEALSLLNVRFQRMLRQDNYHQKFVDCIKELSNITERKVAPNQYTYHADSTYGPFKVTIKEGHSGIDGIDCKMDYSSLRVSENGKKIIEEYRKEYGEQSDSKYALVVSRFSKYKAHLTHLVNHNQDAIVIIPKPPHLKPFYVPKRTTLEPGGQYLPSKSPSSLYDQGWLGTRVKHTDNTQSSFGCCRVTYEWEYMRCFIRRREDLTDEDILAPYAKISEEEKKIFLDCSSSINWKDSTFQQWMKEKDLSPQSNEHTYDFLYRVMQAIAENIVYDASPKQGDSKKLESILKRGSTECDGHSCLFAAVCRANKIPARILGGQMGRSGDDHIKDFYKGKGLTVSDLSEKTHAKPEAFIEGIGWVQAESTRKQFKNNTWDDYVPIVVKYVEKNLNGISNNEAKKLKVNDALTSLFDWELKGTSSHDNLEKQGIPQTVIDFYQYLFDGNKGDQAWNLLNESVKDSFDAKASFVDSFYNFFAKSRKMTDIQSISTNEFQCGMQTPIGKYMVLRIYCTEETIRGFVPYEGKVSESEKQNTSFLNTIGDTIKSPHTMDFSSVSGNNISDYCRWKVEEPVDI